jgi:hypothetical protein
MKLYNKNSPEMRAIPMPFYYLLQQEKTGESQ